MAKREEWGKNLCEQDGRLDYTCEVWHLVLEKNCRVKRSYCVFSARLRAACSHMVRSIPDPG